MARVGLQPVRLLGAAVLAAAATFFAPGVIAQAVPCEVRSAAHIAEHGGLAADSAWHVANGQRPTCGDQAKASPAPAPAASENKDRDDEGKSRYCRKRWFC